MLGFSWSRVECFAVWLSKSWTRVFLFLPFRLCPHAFILQDATWMKHLLIWPFCVSIQFPMGSWYVISRNCAFKIYLTLWRAWNSICLLLVSRNIMDCRMVLLTSKWRRRNFVSIFSVSYHKLAENTSSPNLNSIKQSLPHTCIKYYCSNFPSLGMLKWCMLWCPIST